MLSLEALKSSVAGLVIAREEGPYAAAREALIWNARKPPRYPHVIVGATSAADVQAAVRYARQHGLKVTARGGGHHWSGVALQDGVVIDLSGLDAVTIDPAARIADVGPGVSNRDLARALADHGLAFPVGHCATVPLSGYLLGGGLGWNSGAWGIACFSVESVEVVTAEGERLRASETQNADIFWAARGAGPAFFGVVTSYRLRLHRLPRAITTSTWTYRLEDVSTLERWISSSQPVLPRNVEFSLLMSSAPPALAHRCAKVVTAMVTVFADSLDEARVVLGSVTASAPPGALDASLNVPTPFEALFEMNGAAFPHNRRYAADTYWSAANAGTFLETLAACVKQAPSPASIALGVILPPPEPAAPGLPDAAFSIVAPVFGCSYAVWEDAEDDELNVRWLRQTTERLAPITLGHYIGEAHLEDDAHIPRSFSPAAWARLERARVTYDPEGLFSKPF